MSTATVRRGPAPPRHRWLRLAVPVLVLAMFWLVTLVAHAREQPDLSDAGTMAPGGTGPDGSSLLAQELEGRGIRIDRVGSTEDAVRAATGTDATIFVPAPQFLRPLATRLLLQTPGQHRVVLVKPSPITALLQALDPVPAGERWATRLARPNCGDPQLAAAGAAWVNRARFEASPEAMSCYGGSIVNQRYHDDELVVVGATEPFRNSRFSEDGNAALALALLAGRGEVVWLDLHRREPVPEVELPGIELPRYDRGDQDRTQTGNPLLDAFPALLWAGLLLAAATAVLLAVARSRRLGTPVAEPLPVVVPAAESVTGRGRLYQHARAREATLAALRTAAIRQLAQVLNPFDPARTTALPDVTALTTQIAARTGRDAAAISAILTGPAPTTDEGLAQAVHDLDELVASVVHDTPHNQGGPA